jgi:hypothetical protein
LARSLLANPKTKDGNRFPAQEKDGSEATGLAFAGTSQPLFINASA